MTANNPTATTSPIPSGYRKTEQAAAERRARNLAAPDVRASRAALLLDAETKSQAAREAEITKAQRPVEIFREVLAMASDSQLDELRSTLQRIDGRQQKEIADQVAAARARTRHAADLAASSAPTRKSKAE